MHAVVGGPRFTRLGHSRRRRVGQHLPIKSMHAVKNRGRGGEIGLANVEVMTRMPRFRAASAYGDNFRIGEAGARRARADTAGATLQRIPASTVFPHPSAYLARLADITLAILLGSCAWSSCGYAVLADRAGIQGGILEVGALPTRSGQTPFQDANIREFPRAFRHGGRPDRVLR